MQAPQTRPEPGTRSPAAGDSEVLLSVRHLRTHFFTREGAVPAVDDVTFTVRRGEILGIVGESGSGKSVTARSIMRLVPLPGRIVDGDVLFRDEDLAALSQGEMQRLRGAHMGMVLQEPMTSLNPVLTIGNQVGELFVYHPERTPQGFSVRGAVLDILNRVRIPDAARRLIEYPMHFSGGMRQRVSIAMATGCRPELIIADEPTTALDVTIQAQVLELLLELRNTLGVSVLFITHDLGVVAQICDSVAVMYAGKIVEYNDVESIFDRPRHPYTRALLRSLPQLGTRMARLPSIEGQPPDLGALPPGCAFAPRCPSVVDACRAQVPEPTPLGERGGYVRCFVADDELQADRAAATRSGGGGDGR
ncbi:MAG: ABC transporter ATP-binding protein [Chloroflexi bacterium]|nr:ABC transporter ATP-binding protein [Chloroflexota bacterium]